MLGDIVFPVELVSRGDFGTTILTLLEPTKLYFPSIEVEWRAVHACFSALWLKSDNVSLPFDFLNNRSFF
jgi:hypothetical protein